MSAIAIGNNSGSGGKAYIFVNGYPRWTLGYLKGHWRIRKEIHQHLKDGDRVCGSIDSAAKGHPCVDIIA
ncbi:hypothetical protein GCM10012285_15900 [Streptomyces kronopolitis]|uniref:Uncharacterized protein n=1 Tax=Streptomyces kronopolitis TaxID=1612435 RepID=A0ABQ2J7D2_9ACTN|nr:hypothetical protein GCM10012285_15900 [Streptomyces kronopolitis]